MDNLQENRIYMISTMVKWSRGRWKLTILKTEHLVPAMHRANSVHIYDQHIKQWGQSDA
jgi:hypothetical protein